MANALGDIDEVVQGIPARSLKGRKVLVTGGAGFIGSWLCDSLVRAKAEVLSVDNLSSGNPRNVAHLSKSGLFELRKADIATKKIRDAEFDYILHFASHAAPEEYQLYPVETLLANSLGTKNVLEHAKKCNAIVVYASSSEVYGDAETFPTPETYWGKVNPVGPRSCYDEGKRFGEAMCLAYLRQHGVDVRIARIFNTYGPRMRTDGAYARVVPRFIRQALTGDRITVYGDGKQTRSFCYFSDTIAAILRLMLSLGTKGEVLNIGNPRETTIIELARMIKRITGSDARMVLSQLPADDPKRRKPDVSKARNLLGWQPKIGLDDGLRRTIGWFKAQQLDES
ncbi:MAG: SDR family oxidoreductase [Nitrososphaerales archaeon]|nr:SDR family oxidoreductase [Nitrososphaerales archaeon]